MFLKSFTGKNRRITKLKRLSRCGFHQPNSPKLGRWVSVCTCQRVSAAHVPLARVSVSAWNSTFHPHRSNNKQLATPHDIRIHTNNPPTNAQRQQLINQHLKETTNPNPNTDTMRTWRSWRWHVGYSLAVCVFVQV